MKTSTSFSLFRCLPVGLTACIALSVLLPLPVQGLTDKEIDLQIAGKRRSISACEKRIKTRCKRIEMHEACRDLHGEDGWSTHSSSISTHEKPTPGGGAVCDGVKHKIIDFDPVTGKRMTVSHGCPSRVAGGKQDGVHQAISYEKKLNEADELKIRKYEREIELLESKRGTSAAAEEEA